MVVRGELRRAVVVGLMLAGVSPAVLARPAATGRATHAAAPLAYASACGNGATVDANADLAFGGEVHAMAVFGGLAFLGVGPRLVAWDVEDLAAARELGASPSLPGRVIGLHVAGAYAFAATRDAGVHVIATSNLAAPTAVGAVPLAGPVAALAGARDHVYVAGLGLQVLDIANPRSPVPTAVLDERRMLSAVAAGADRLFFGGADGQLVAYGLRDPSHPVWEAEVRLGGPIAGLALAGDRLVVAGGFPEGRGLVVVDVSRAGAPRVVGSLDLADPAERVAVRGDLAHVTDAGGQWSVIDLARPEAPRLLATRPLGADAAAIAATAGRTFVAAGGRLAVWGTRDVATAPPIADIAVGWPARGMAAGDDGRVYVAAGREGVKVVASLDSPPPPAVLGEGAFGVPGAPSFGAVGLPGGWGPIARRPSSHTADASPKSSIVEVAVVGQHLLAADEMGALEVFDITSLSISPSPTATSLLPIGRITTPGPVRHVAGAGDRAYVTVGDRDVWIVDLGDPALPRRVGTFTPDVDDVPADDRLTDLAAIDSLVYIAFARSGLRVVDASDPARPRGVAALPRAGDRMRLGGGFLYTWRADHDLRVFDVRTPAAPVEAGRLTDAAWTVVDFDVRDGDAWAIVRDDSALPPGAAAADAAGLRLWRLDASNPAAPRVVGDQPLAFGGADGVAIVGDGAVVAAGADGLIAVRPDGVVPVTRSCRAYVPLLHNGPAAEKAATVTRLWTWANVHRSAERKDLRVSDVDGDGRAELWVGDDRYRFLIRHGEEGRRTKRVFDALAPVWGVDDMDGDESPELWQLGEDGTLTSASVVDGLLRAPGNLAIDPGARIRAGLVADLFGDGQPVLVTLVAPAPNPLGPPRERWALQAWQLPALTSAWRFAIDGVPAGLTSDLMRVAQLDDDGAREVVVSFPGGRRPGSSFPHGWVVDPARSAAQWTYADGFGAHVATADLDGDGMDELVGAPAERSGTVVAAFDVDLGREKWRVPRPPTVMAAADVTGDGAAEVVVGSAWGGVAILNGATAVVEKEVRDPSLTGAILGIAVVDRDEGSGRDVVWALQPAGASTGRLLALSPEASMPYDAMARHAGPYWPIAMTFGGERGPGSGIDADVIAFPQVEAPPSSYFAPWLALDGASGAELVGAPLELASQQDGSSPAGVPLAANLDGDPGRELAVGWGDRLVVLDDDGWKLAERDMAGAGVDAPWPVWAGDADGDGSVDLVVAGRRAIVVLRASTLAEVGRIDDFDRVDGIAPEVSRVAVGDIDGDGGIEIVVHVRGADVEVWDARDRRREGTLAGTAWATEALVVAPDGVEGAALPRLGVVIDGRLTWFDGRTLGATGDTVDLRHWDEETSALAFVGVPGWPEPGLVTSGGGAIHLYRHYLDPGAMEAPVSVDLGESVRRLVAADLDGDGADEILVGLDDGVEAFRVVP